MVTRGERRSGEGERRGPNVGSGLAGGRNVSPQRKRETGVRVGMAHVGAAGRRGRVVTALCACSLTAVARSPREAYMDYRLSVWRARLCGRQRELCRVCVCV